jgi:hypothetical protein
MLNGDLVPLAHARFMLEAWRTDSNTSRPHSRLGWMTPDAYAEIRRAAALRSTDGSAPPIAAITAYQDITDRPTPIVTGWNLGAGSLPTAFAIRARQGAASGSPLRHHFARPS